LYPATATVAVEPHIVTRHLAALELPDSHEISIPTYGMVMVYCVYHAWLQAGTHAGLAGAYP